MLRFWPGTGYNIPVTTPTASATAVLRAFPVALFTAAREQWEAMLREYALRGLGGTAQSYGADEVAQAGTALALVDAAAAQLDPDAGDVDLPLEVEQPSAFAVLQGILDDAIRLARAGDLLVFPPLPEVVALRNWVCDEALGQSAGGSPTPWEFVTLDARDEDEAAHWDRAVAPPDAVAWIVGDDHNRIVGVSPAALDLLGWTEDALVGQRLLAVIPPALREAHVAGFTRSALGGGGALLGRPVAVPALARDGREVPITLTLTRHAARGGRAVYLATME